MLTLRFLQKYYVNKFYQILIISILSSVPVYKLNSRPEEKTGIISQVKVRDAVYEGFNYIYNFEFIKADNVLQELKKNYSFSPWTYLYAANFYWWKIISGENTTTNVELFYSSLNTARNKIGNLNTNENQFLKIVIYSLMSRYDVMNGKYIQAVVELKKNLSIIKNTLNKESQFYGFYLTSGLYLYLTDVVYSNYYYLRPFMLFIPSGDKAKGLQFLTKKHNDPILDTESEYFLMKIYDEVECRNEISMQYSSGLVKKYPMNFIFREQQLKSLIKLRNNPLSKDEVSFYKKQILSNKQLSKSQTQYLLNLANKLQSRSS